MSPLLGLIVITLGALASLVVWLFWQNSRPNKAEAWPVTAGTIQSVGTVVVSSRGGSYSVDVGDFSYTVNNEYYSGRLAIASSIGDSSPRGLVNQRIQVHYDPRKPEKFFVPRTEAGVFILDMYNEPFGEDVDPIDLNIDKI